MTAEQLAALVAGWLDGGEEDHLPLADALEELGQPQAAQGLRTAQPLRPDRLALALEGRLLWYTETMIDMSKLVASVPPPPGRPYVDWEVLLDLLDGLTGDLRESAVCDTSDALSSIRDRAKATRLLRRCLSDCPIRGLKRRCGNGTPVGFPSDTGG